MENNGGNTKKIVIIVVILLVVLGILYFTVFNKKSKVEYNLTTSSSAAQSTLFNDYNSFKKFIQKNNVNENIENKVTFKKSTLDEKYTEEFFNDKKLAVVVVYEDTSKDYMYSIDEVVYDSAKKEATIRYTYKYTTYAGTLDRTWYDYMFVELDKNVEHVIFENHNSK